MRTDKGGQYRPATSGFAPILAVRLVGEWRPAFPEMDSGVTPIVRCMTTGGRQARCNAHRKREQCPRKLLAVVVHHLPGESLKHDCRWILRSCVLLRLASGRMLFLSRGPWPYFSSKNRRGMTSPMNLLHPGSLPGVPCPDRWPCVAPSPPSALGRLCNRQ